MATVESGAGLDPARRGLVRLSAALGGAAPDEWRTALLDARAAAPDVAIEEALLQAHLFVGFPVTLNALILWREIAGSPAQDGAEVDPETRRRRGEALCRRVYGPAYDRLRENVRALHPDLDRWMVETGYGRTLSRPGLDAVTRELCVVAILAAAGHERQLESHLRGALNVGAALAAIDEAIEIAGADRARRAWTRVRRRFADAGPDPAGTRKEVDGCS